MTSQAIGLAIIKAIITNFIKLTDISVVIWVNGNADRAVRGRIVKCVGKLFEWLAQRANRKKYPATYSG